jgi:hypothetical protein
MYTDFSKEDDTLSGMRADMKRTQRIAECFAVASIICGAISVACFVFVSVWASK